VLGSYSAFGFVVRYLHIVLGSVLGGVIAPVHHVSVSLYTFCTQLLVFVTCYLTKGVSRRVELHITSCIARGSRSYSNSVASAIALSSSIKIAFCMTNIIGGMHVYAKVSVLRCLCKASAKPQACLTAKILSLIVRPPVALSVPSHFLALSSRISPIGNAKQDGSGEG